MGPWIQQDLNWRPPRELQLSLETFKLATASDSFFALGERERKKMASAKYQSIPNKSDMHNVWLWKTKLLTAILEFVLFSENYFFWRVLKILMLGESNLR